MKYWDRAVLTAFWSAIFIAIVIGFWYAGVGGALLGIACVWIATLCLTEFWTVVLLGGLFVGAIYFWNVGL
tara:strand:- start:2610 stop:2822 length:213 start_codon:yes stop_codon:yes gene_type:complete